MKSINQFEKETIMQINRYKYELKHFILTCGDEITNAYEEGTSGFCVCCKYQMTDVEAYDGYLKCPKCGEDAVFSVKELAYQRAMYHAPVPSELHSLK